MKHRVIRPFAGLGIFVLIISLACSGGRTPTEVPASTQASVEADQPSAQPTKTSVPQKDPLLVISLDDVRKAVIQIEAEGTFIDPEVGWNVNVGKRGSGIIIDSQGIAITNNHVVTGSDSLSVWVGGDSTKTYNAKILGVSECSDLAVIDIDGDGFSYVQWLDGDIRDGQQVYAAGFLLGDSQFSLTDGIVSKSAANGDTSWVSVDSVIEHTAKINSGNSGGPLVDVYGNLVGINYAVVSETDQNFAISRDEVLPVINQLRLGKNVDSIGINGGAVFGTINGMAISGVWVRSVAPASPASNAGIQPGDMIYQLENEVLATDGSMADYCDVLRSRNASDPMAVTVIRWSDLSLWEGQVNGAEMNLSGYFDQGSSGSDSADTSALPANCSYSNTDGYLSCVDDTEAITIDIPETWLDINGSEWIFEGKIIGVAISASPDLEAFDYDKNTPGLFFGASDTFAQWGGYIQFLDVYTDWYRQACDFDGRFDYNDSIYRGKVDYYSHCDGRNGGNAYVLAVVPISDPTSAMIIITIQLPANEETTLDHIWNSFYLVGM